MRSFIGNIWILAVIGIGFFVLLLRPETSKPPSAATATSSIAQEVPQIAAASSATATTSKKITKAPMHVATTTASVVKKIPETAASSTEVNRVPNPYSTPPLPGDELNSLARSALVNILCLPRRGGLSPVSGSGVIIDPRGVVLTNAHVAQYVLLSEDARIDLSCTVRLGAPAVPLYSARVLYIPSAWVDAHAKDIVLDKAPGTGEHDYALLLIEGAVNGASVPTVFSSVAPDTREAIGFQGDQVLVASYPAEFLGGIASIQNLYPASSATSIEQLHTFERGSVDVISLGGIIEAQSGSSGGEVVNAWGRLLGLIATMSEGATTGERNLHALTLSYIDRDLVVQTGGGLSALLAGDIYQKEQDFSETSASELAQKLIDVLRR